MGAGRALAWPHCAVVTRHYMRAYVPGSSLDVAQLRAVQQCVRTL
jgi:hypothetical protein